MRKTNKTSLQRATSWSCSIILMHTMKQNNRYGNVEKSEEAVPARVIFFTIRSTRTCV